MKKNKKVMVVSELYVESKNLELRYKALKKTIKELEKFERVAVTNRVAEA